MGNGIVAGSLTAGGRWLELGITHPRHGRIVVTDTPPLSDDQRLDQPRVRAYRAALASRARPGFGVAGLVGDATVLLLEASVPVALHGQSAGRPEVVTVAPPGRRGAVQVIRVARAARAGFDIAWTGIMRLDRASYTQLTPGGALPVLAPRPAAGSRDRRSWIADPVIGAAVAVALPSLDPESGAFITAVAFGDDVDDAVREVDDLARHAVALIDEAITARRALWTGAGLPHVGTTRRAVAFALDCAAARAPDGALAVLADHVILPLVWTRDAYYVCRALLALVPREGAELTAAFLRWCFETAERPDGWWPRASLASGQAKDLNFQLDQQLYPLLLLTDHARLTHDTSLVQRFTGERDRVLAALRERRSAHGLIATAETPADDPIEAPFHFSSHVLLWRVLRDLDTPAADQVRSAALSHFVADGRFAYAVRGPFADGAYSYHDANDLPTVFAPGWGFCAADDPRWRATVAFAWSDENRGHVSGAFGGLGSVHTLHPWPLGDLQDLVVARVLRDRARASRARARLRRVATWDDLLPEAYDETTGAVASRHWFAWPVLLRAFLEQDPTVIAP